jgi:hypothetical protein
MKILSKVTKYHPRTGEPIKIVMMKYEDEVFIRRGEDNPKWYKRNGIDVKVDNRGKEILESAYKKANSEQ